MVSHPPSRRGYSRTNRALPSLKRGGTDRKVTRSGPTLLALSTTQAKVFEGNSKDPQPVRRAHSTAQRNKTRGAAGWAIPVARASFMQTSLHEGVRNTRRTPSLIYDGFIFLLSHGAMPAG